jgi:hypothetical protein
MKKITMLAIVCALALGLAAPTASAVELDLTSSQYLGLIDDGIPSSATDEVGYINILIGLAPGAPTQTIGSETYTRSNNPCPVGGCPTASAVGGVKNETGSFTNIDVTGWSYLIAKYDGPNYGSVVWYVGGLNELVDIPDTLGTGNWEISHYSLYNPSTSVPDGGFTLMLLGGALVGLEGLRRKYRI